MTFRFYLPQSKAELSTMSNVSFNLPSSEKRLSKMVTCNSRGPSVVPFLRKSRCVPHLLVQSYIFVNPTKLAGKKALGLHVPPNSTYFAIYKYSSSDYYCSQTVTSRLSRPGYGKEVTGYLVPQKKYELFVVGYI